MISNKRIAKTLTFIGNAIWILSLISCVLIIVTQIQNISPYVLMGLIGVIISSTISSFVLLALARILSMVDKLDGKLNNPEKSEAAL